MIGRRGFLQCIGAGVLGIALALKAADIEPVAAKLYETFGVDFEWQSLDVNDGFPGIDYEALARAFGDDLDREIALKLSRDGGLSWSHEFVKPFKLGDVVRIRVPKRYHV